MEAFPLAAKSITCFEIPVSPLRRLTSKSRLMTSNFAHRVQGMRATSSECWLQTEAQEHRSGNILNVSLLHHIFGRGSDVCAFRERGVGAHSMDRKREVSLTASAQVSAVIRAPCAPCAEALSEDRRQPRKATDGSGRSSSSGRSHPAA